MPLRQIVIFALTAFLTGCIPVTEPLSDVSRAESDAQLFGAWAWKHEVIGKVRRIVIDAPLIEGNPKGLIRVRNLDDLHAEPTWMFPTLIGKAAYLSIIDSTSNGEKQFDFLRPGDFAKWQVQMKSDYTIIHYRVESGMLTLNSGDKAAFAKLMKKEKFDQPGPERRLPEGVPPSADPYYNPPSGWLANYLGKNGSEGLFPKKLDQTYTRQKW